LQICCFKYTKSTLIRVETDNTIGCRFGKYVAVADDEETMLSGRGMSHIGQNYESKTALCCSGCVGFRYIPRRRMWDWTFQNCSDPR
jgi:hypothetical protein